ncbi:MHF histone-fold complex component [Fusarium oxysporum]|nr:MHF histone-fold complex component [Fusarium oxysporum]KAJ4283372.1 MHF histone-fold complex component [Fusarium oxysporum]
MWSSQIRHHQLHNNKLLFSSLNSNLLFQAESFLCTLLSNLTLFQQKKIDMADTTSDEDRERLKAALWYAVGQIVDEESLRRNRNATPQFIGALTELVWTQVENVATDLESFSNHAGRSTVTTDDVLLLARKNPDLHQIMKEFVDQAKAEKGTAKSRGGASKR